MPWYVLVASSAKCSWRVAVSLVGTLLAIQGHIKLIAANGVAFLPLCLFLGSYRWSLFCAIECFWKMSCWLICEIVLLHLSERNNGSKSIDLKRQDTQMKWPIIDSNEEMCVGLLLWIHLFFSCAYSQAM